MFTLSKPLGNVGIILGLILSMIVAYVTTYGLVLISDMASVVEKEIMEKENR